MILTLQIAIGVILGILILTYLPQILRLVLVLGIIAIVGIVVVIVGVLVYEYPGQSIGGVTVLSVAALLMWGNDQLRAWYGGNKANPRVYWTAASAEILFTGGVGAIVGMVAGVVIFFLASTGLNAVGTQVSDLALIWLSVGLLGIGAIGFMLIECQKKRREFDQLLIEQAKEIEAKLVFDSDASRTVDP